MAFLVEIKAVKKSDLKGEAPDLRPITVEEAEALTGDGKEGEMDDLALQWDDDNDVDTSSLVAKVGIHVQKHCVTKAHDHNVTQIRKIVHMTQSTP